MKYGIISDLHLDFWSANNIQELIDKINVTKCDWLLIAGDVAESPVLRQQFLLSLKIPFLVIDGNHEYYHGYFSDCRIHSADANVVGCTLWTNFWDNPLYELSAQQNINDFRCIEIPLPDKARNINSFDVLDAHRYQREWIRRHPTTLVAMTHFSPTPRGIAPMYAAYTELNAYFHCNDMDDIIATKKLWVYGHTHSHADFMDNGCRMINNALGYPNENINKISDYKIVVVDV